MSDRETTSDGDSIECPVCAKFIGDLWEYGIDGSHETECPSCDAPLTLTVATTVTYTATPRGEQTSGR